MVGGMMGFFGAGIALSSVWALLIIDLGWRWALLLTAPYRPHRRHHAMVLPNRRDG